MDPDKLSGSGADFHLVLPVQPEKMTWKGASAFLKEDGRESYVSSAEEFFQTF